MARALIEGGPADGDALSVENNPPILYYAKVADRAAKTWVTLERYCWVPPQDRAKRIYRHGGTHSVQGPVVGMDDWPNWSI